jgi:hypothetical protein
MKIKIEKKLDKNLQMGKFREKNRDKQCCGSGMFIPDPDFYPSRIPDLGSRIQKQQ